jgi:hypothetical protein
MESSMTEQENDGAWFVQHRWGYGVGMPIAWQGWPMMALQIVVAGCGVIAFANNETAQLMIIVLVIFVPFPLMVAKTRGGWRWRWGERD